MNIFVTLLLACAQKDPPSAPPPQKPEPIIEKPSPPPPPPKPTTTTLPEDPWILHSSLLPIKEDMYQKEWEKVLPVLEKRDDERAALLRGILEIKRGNPLLAEPYIAQLSSTSLLPQDYLALQQAEIYIAKEDVEKATQKLQSIPEKSPFFARAQRKMVPLLQEGDRIQKLLELLPTASREELPFILAQLLENAPTKAQRFYYLKQIYTRLPKTPLAITTHPQLKTLLAQKGFTLTKEDKLTRVESLMRDQLFKAAHKEAKAIISYQTADPLHCRLWYAYGRALFKTNNVTASQKPLLETGKRCKGIRDDLAPKAYYIAGKGLERKKEYASAAAAFAAIPAHFPEHSMADDGYLLAGIDWQTEERLDKALPMWSKQVNDFPQGDMIFEGYWRLAWGLYLNGRTQEAQKWAAESKKRKLQGDITHAMALRYWNARWYIFPDAQNPTQPNQDPAHIQKGIQELIEICATEPTHFYALLASQLLRELAPDRLKKIASPSWLTTPPKREWTVPIALTESESFVRARQFAEMGLIAEALQEATSLTKNSATLHSIFALLEKKSDPIRAHDRLHKILNKYAPSTFSANHLLILEHGYPQTYFSLVQEVSSTYQFDPRIFHSLIREESSFNAEIVSWAGAKGLSQLMPGTAKQVAKWLNISFRKELVFDPKTNLRIGSRYLEYLFSYFHGNPFMAVGAYNAGEGNMKKWHTQFGPLPTDHLIEKVPFRETRGYIKRVLGTYQLYTVLSHKKGVFSDFHQFNALAQP